MKPDTRAFVAISGQTGEGVDTQRFLTLVADLNGALERHTRKAYSREIRRMYTTFRVDGLEQIAWHESGLKRLQLQGKRGYVSVDVCFQWDEHNKVPPLQLMGLVFERESRAIYACVERIRKGGIEFDFGSFEADAAAALDEVWRKWFPAAES